MALELNKRSGRWKTEKFPTLTCTCISRTRARQLSTRDSDQLDSALTTWIKTVMRVQTNLSCGHLQIETIQAVNCHHLCLHVASITHTRSQVRTNEEVLKVISIWTRVGVGALVAASTQASSVTIESLMAVTLMKAHNEIVVFLLTKNWRQITRAIWVVRPLITTIKSSLLSSKTNLLINLPRSKKN